MSTPTPPSGGSESFSATFSRKFAGLPVGVWIGLLAVVGGYLWYRHNQTANSTAAAASQTNTDLGSAANAQNQFAVAGLMPYSGGDTYINSVGTGTIGSPTPPANTPTTVAVAKGDSASTLIANIRAKVNPNFSWADFWALNPKIAGIMKQDPKTKQWTFVKGGTVTISQPGMVNVPGGSAA